MPVNWINVGAESEFGDGLRLVTIDRKRVVVARLKGRLFAFDALCPHAGGPMDLSEVEGAIISCPLHAWRFDLEQGGIELHGYRSLPLKDVKAEDGAIFVAMEA